MSKMTDRLSDNQHIIDLAKKQYEDSQYKTKVPSNIVSLPSKGLIYNESHPLRAGSVEMRTMTAYDEDVLTNSTYIKKNIVLQKLLESLITTPGVNIDDMPTYDQEAMLISARIFAYGNEYPIIATDPKTGNQLDRKIKLTQIKFKSFNLISDKNGEFEYMYTPFSDDDSKNDIHFKFKYLTEKESKSLSTEHFISKFLELTIQEIDNNREKQYIKDFIKYELLPRDSKKFRDYILENQPGVNYDIEVEGEDGSAFITRFRYGSDFFRI